MRSIVAIFIKQTRDVFKNPMVLINFLLFPIVALIMTQLVAKGNDDIPNNMFVTMMAAIFAGMGLITTVSGAIAEDIERSCLRFLVLAGVKPGQYLIGISGFFMLGGVATSIIFTLIGDFSIQEAAKFLAVMIGGVAASVLLGAVISMWAKNAQTATALGMPVAVIAGFTPMIANFNETIERFAGVLYTQQINVIVNDFSAGIWRPLMVIAINIAVLSVLFVVAYKRKGLRG